MFQLAPECYACVEALQGTGPGSLGRCQCWVWYTLYHVVCRVGDTSSYFEPRVTEGDNCHARRTPVSTPICDRMVSEQVAFILGHIQNHLALWRLFSLDLPCGHRSFWRRRLLRALHVKAQMGLSVMFFHRPLLPSAACIGYCLQMRKRGLETEP